MYIYYEFLTASCFAINDMNISLNHESNHCNGKYKIGFHHYMLNAYFCC